jgi:hypothetical protein
VTETTTEVLAMPAHLTFLSHPAHTRVAVRRLVLALALVLPALALMLLAYARPSHAVAQPSDPYADSWRTALQVAPVTAGEQPIGGFAGVILISPSRSDLFSGWVV